MRSAMSVARSPQMPHLTISTVSPGSSKLSKQASMPPWPDTLRARVSLFLVWKTYCNPTLMSSINCGKNSSDISLLARESCYLNLSQSYMLMMKRDSFKIARFRVAPEIPGTSPDEGDRAFVARENGERDPSSYRDRDSSKSFRAQSPVAVSPPVASGKRRIVARYVNLPSPRIFSQGLRSSTENRSRNLTRSRNIRRNISEKHCVHPKISRIVVVWFLCVRLSRTVCNSMNLRFSYWLVLALPRIKSGRSAKASNTVSR